MKFVKRTVEFLPLCITVGLTAYVIYWHRVSPFKTDTLLVLVLTILALIVVTELPQRYLRLREISNELSDLRGAVHSVTSGRLAQFFLKERSDFIPFERRIANARDVWFLGTSLEGMVSFHLDLLMERVRDGCRLRFLLLDPDSDAIAARSFGLFSVTEPQVLRNDVHKTLERLRHIKRTVAHASIQIKVTRFISSYGMVLVDPRQKRGEIIVELYPYQISASDRPHFELTPSDAKWFQYFAGQYRDIWNDARDISNGLS